MIENHLPGCCLCGYRHRAGTVSRHHHGATLRAAANDLSGWRATEIELEFIVEVLAGRCNSDPTIHRTVVRLQTAEGSLHTRTGDGDLAIITLGMSDACGLRGVADLKSRLQLACSFGLEKYSCGAGLPR